MYDFQYSSNKNISYYYNHMNHLVEALQRSLQYYEDQYNWNGFEFLLAIQKVGTFQKNNTDIAVNVAFNSKKGIYTACSSLKGIKVWVFFKKKHRKKRLCCLYKNYYYYCKSNIPEINLIEI